jgi:hypothetical protein
LVLDRHRWFNLANGGTVRFLKRGSVPLWDGESPFSSRLATAAEQADWHQWRLAG